MVCYMYYMSAFFFVSLSMKQIEYFGMSKKKNTRYETFLLKKEEPEFRIFSSPFWN